MARRRGNGGFGEIDWSRVDWNDIPGFRRRAGGPPRRRTLVIWVVVVLLFLVPPLLGGLVGFWTDLLWFRSLGLDSVYLRRYSAAFYAFLAFFLVFLAFAGANVFVATRPRLVPRVVDVGAPPPRIFTYRRVAAVLMVPAFFFGLAAGGRWDDILRYLNQTPFGATDALFGQDVSFYFFSLPVLSFLRDWGTAAVLVTAAIVALTYFFRGVLGFAAAGLTDVGSSLRGAVQLARPVRAHLSVLGAIFLLLVAFGYQLDKYDLLFRTEGGFLTGAGFASVNARLPALMLLTAIAVIAAVLLLANVWARTLWLLGAALGAWLVLAVLVGGIYPALVERFVVQPAQLEQERPYIGRHIVATRAAFGVDQVDEKAFEVKDAPTPDDVSRDLTSIENVRIWDYRPLEDTLAQLQTLRNYYEFPDVDVTRVPFGGKPQQLMVAARELNAGKVQPQSWVNVHLVFTHGYGAVGVPVSAVTPEGLPALSLKDFPPAGEPPVSVPQIYYGQETSNYVIVGTSAAEFDYPKQEGVEQTTRYAGGGGIGVGGLWDRFLFAVRFGDLNLLISNQLSSGSRLLMHREITSREELIAPFLQYDRDPYLAFMDGKLYWIHDAYTTGSRYPYSEALGNARRYGAEGIGDASTNYMRNSVKVVTDAYDGSLTFYVADPTDPVVRTLAKIYPGLFHDLGAMPPALRAQLRYPEDLFRVQLALYGRYHVTDPDVFYNGSDQWQLANEILQQGGPAQATEPYYVITRLPDGTAPEFLLFAPLTPSGRDNMIGWLAGRSDEPNYGKLRALRFSTASTIFGPMQIEARIEQDPVIKTQLALLSQVGSRVFHGNLLVIPLGSSFLYVEPIFLQAQSGSIPELRRVVLATQTKVVMADTFPNALAALTGSQVPSSTQPPPPPPSGAVSDQVLALVKSMADHDAKAQAALRSGDLATYATEIAALEKDLAALRDLTGAH